MDYVMRHRSTVGGALEMFSLPLPFFTGVAHLILIGVRLRWQCFLWSLMSLVCPGVRSGPILFYLYILPIAHIVLECGVSLQQYADDTQLDISCSVSDSGSALSTLKSCLAAAFLVLSQWSSSEPWQIWGNNICHLPTPQLFPRPFVIHILSSSVPISDYITTRPRRHSGL